MTGWWWGSAMVLTIMGALSYWSAGVLKVEAFYRDACLFLLTAFIFVCLAGGLP